MKGKLIIIEGTDCSGKECQAKKLFEKLESVGKKVYRCSFPNYDTPTGKIVGGPYLGKSYICDGWFSEEMSKSAHQKKDKEESARANRDTERRIRLSDTIPNLDFRPLKRENKEEINFIYNIKKEKYKEENKKELDKEILNKLLERYIKENAKNIKVIMLKEEKIGFFDGKILENNTFRIDNIFILKEYQNKGIETAISNEILFENEKVDKSK